MLLMLVCYCIIFKTIYIILMKMISVLGFIFYFLKKEVIRTESAFWGVHYCRVNFHISAPCYDLAFLKNFPPLPRGMKFVGRRPALLGFCPAPLALKRRENPVCIISTSFQRLCQRNFVLASVSTLVQGSSGFRLEKLSIKSRPRCQTLLQTECYATLRPALWPAQL